MGGQIFSHYYQAAKGKHYVKDISAYLIILNSLEKVADKKEQDEQLEVKTGSYEEVMSKIKAYNNPNGNAVEYQVEILNRDWEVISKEA